MITIFYNQLEPGVILQLTVTVLSNTSVNISWEPPLLTNGIILYYVINIRSLQLTEIKPFNDSASVEPTKSLYQLIQNLSQLHVNLYSLAIMIHSIDPYIPYEVNIYAVTITGAGKGLSEVFFTQETGII